MNCKHPGTEFSIYDATTSHVLHFLNSDIAELLGTFYVNLVEYQNRWFTN